VRIGDGCFAITGIRIRFDRVQRSRSAALRDGVDEDRGVVAAAGELVGEMNASNAEIDDLHAIPERLIAQTLRDFHAEPVVAQEDVADAGHQDAGHQSADDHIAIMRR